MNEFVLDYGDMEEPKLEKLYAFLVDIGWDKEAAEVKELLDECYFYGAQN